MEGREVETMGQEATREMDKRPLGEPQPGNLYPEWGPWCPVIRLLPQAARDALLEFIEAGSVSSGAAEVATGWWNIGGVIGTQRVPTLQQLARDNRLPVYHAPTGRHFSGRFQVKSPLSQLIRWMQANDPNRLLSLGLDEVNW